uniref:Protein kinase domain-containing protein n=1 Tax=Macrostomum lignano TaxID=282301 RepID=A0A1I8JMU8_9PLAT
QPADSCISRSDDIVRKLDSIGQLGLSGILLLQTAPAYRVGFPDPEKTGSLCPATFADVSRLWFLAKDFCPTPYAWDSFQCWENGSSTTTSVNITTVASSASKSCGRRDDGSPTAALNDSTLSILTTDREHASLQSGLYHEFRALGRILGVQLHGGILEDRYATVMYRRADDASALWKLRALASIIARQFKRQTRGPIPPMWRRLNSSSSSRQLKPTILLLHEYHPRATRTLFVGNLDPKTVWETDLRDALSRLAMFWKLQADFASQKCQRDFMEDLARTGGKSRSGYKQDEFSSPYSDQSYADDYLPGGGRGGPQSSRSSSSRRQHGGGGSSRRQQHQHGYNRHQPGATSSPSGSGSQKGGGGRGWRHSSRSPTSHHGGAKHSADSSTSSSPVRPALGSGDLRSLLERSKQSAGSLIPLGVGVAPAKAPAARRRKSDVLVWSARLSLGGHPGRVHRLLHSVQLFIAAPISSTSASSNRISALTATAASAAAGGGHPTASSRRRDSSSDSNLSLEKTSPMLLLATNRHPQQLPLLQVLPPLLMRPQRRSDSSADSVAGSDAENSSRKKRHRTGSAFDRNASTPETRPRSRVQAQAACNAPTPPANIQKQHLPAQSSQSDSDDASQEASTRQAEQRTIRWPLPHSATRILRPAPSASTQQQSCERATLPVIFSCVPPPAPDARSPPRGSEAFNSNSKPATSSSKASQQTRSQVIAARAACRIWLSRIASTILVTPSCRRSRQTSAPPAAASTAAPRLRHLAARHRLPRRPSASLRPPTHSGASDQHSSPFSHHHQIASSHIRRLHVSDF